MRRIATTAAIWSSRSSHGAWRLGRILIIGRFASNIASEGYIVALPSSFHEFEGPEPIPYDTEGTDRGNKYKIEKTVEGYDEVRDGVTTHQ